MGKVATTVNTVITSDATFRTWGSAVSAALTAAGLTQTSDTGQINWTTVLKPTSQNIVAGFEMYRFNDTLHSTKPVFLKIAYGSNGNISGNNPMLSINVGTGTNGAGTLTGTTLTSAASYLLTGANISNAGAAANSPLWICYNGGHLTFAHGSFSSNANTSYASNPGTFFLSRTVDPSTGADTGDGLGVVYNDSAASSFKSMDFVSSTTSAASYPQAVPLTYDLGQNTPNELFVYPYYIPTGNGPRMLGGVLACANIGLTFNTLPEYSILSSEIVEGGTSRTYLAFTGSSGPSMMLNATVLGAQQNLSNITNENSYSGICGIWE